MADILLDFPIQASTHKVFEGIATPSGLDTWWTKQSSGESRLGAEFELGFGPGYNWRARVTRYVPDREIEFEMVHADGDWTGTRVGFVLTPVGANTQVQFTHMGWPKPNEHYRTSCYCWAMYLRHLKRYVEAGIVVSYDKRLDV
jgi:uncharacterized protein YndB with AHSA1/START domain